MHLPPRPIITFYRSDLAEIKDILSKRFDTIDYVQAKEDVLPFIKHPASLDVWDKDFFCTITENLTEKSGLIK